MKHLVNISQLNKATIQQLIDKALELKSLPLNRYKSNLLGGQVVAKLFFEPSTRTRNSFEIAAYRLGAFVISPDMKESALTKGETMYDTLKTLEAMGVHAAIIRHSSEGVVQQLAEQSRTMAIINAGDGCNQHPTQALIDLMTIYERFPSWHEVTVTVIGDIKYSRVARSLIQGLGIMGAKTVRLIAPPTLLPKKPLGGTVDVFNSIEEGLPGSDVIVCLRLQKERMTKQTQLNEQQFTQSYCLTEKRLRLAKTHAIVMHPGPVNRDVEIGSVVADGSQCVMLEQVTNSIALRMSVLEYCLS